MWRSSPLPSNWHRIRRQVLNRDSHKCQICQHIGTQVDHINSSVEHTLTNLRTLCTQCHNKRSSYQAIAKKAEMRKWGRREEERHPLDQVYIKK